MLLEQAKFLAGVTNRHHHYRRPLQRGRSRIPERRTWEPRYVDPFGTIARAASFASRPLVRQRKRGDQGFGFASTASALRPPSTGANLNACPLSPAATIRPARAGSGAIQKSPSNVSQYKHSRVATIGAAASAGRD